MSAVAAGLSNPIGRASCRSCGRAHACEQRVKAGVLVGIREQPSVPPVITLQAVRKFLSGLAPDAGAEQAVAVLLKAVSPREVASFVVVREERGCQAEAEGDAASPCSLPAAASQVSSS